MTDFSNTKFGHTIALNNELVEQSNVDMVAYEQHKAVEKLAHQILGTKMWRFNTIDDMLYVDMELYVFTREELKAFVESKGGRF